MVRLIAQWRKWFPTSEMIKEQRDKQRKKNAAKVRWQVSQATVGKQYPVANTDYEMSFANNVITGTQEFVKEQEKNNPEWNAWVAEWEQIQPHKHPSGDAMLEPTELDDWEDE